MSQKIYTDNTLKNLTKDELIGLIKVLENNIRSNEEIINNQAKLLGSCDEIIAEQAKMLESKHSVVNGDWDDSFDGITPFCSVCGRSHHGMIRTPKYCPNCGAKMREDVSNERY